MNLGISLSGGGIKGAAHIGVLKALEEENIKCNYISGTSSGSIVATLYACGFTPDEIYGVFKEYSGKIKCFGWKSFIYYIMGLLFKGRFIPKGLNTGEVIEKLINKKCQEKGIENIKQIKMPLIIPSVDLYTGEVYIFTSQKFRGSYIDSIKYVEDVSIGRAVRASCSYPGIFFPCPYQKTELIDGGIRENVPWKETKKMGANKVISVVFDKEIERKKNNNMIDVISDSIDILCHELSSYELVGADYIIKLKTKDISLLDNSEIDNLYKQGYKQTKKQINKISNYLKENNWIM